MAEGFFTKSRDNLMKWDLRKDLSACGEGQMVTAVGPRSTGNQVWKKMNKDSDGENYSADDIGGDDFHRNRGAGLA